MYNANITIKINTSFSIVGFENAIIYGPPHSYLFEVETKTKVQIVIMDIGFSQIGVLVSQYNVNITIRKCTFSNLTGSMVLINRSNGEISVRIMSSIFRDNEDYVLSIRNASVGHSMKVFVDGCNFTKSKGLFVQSYNQASIVITNCIFFG